MGEPKTPHFYDLGISERVPEPQNHYYLSLETPGCPNKNQEKALEPFKNPIIANTFFGFRQF